MWYLYILKCSDKSLYTGVTTDVARRFKEHQAGKGAKALRAKRPLGIVYQEKHRTRGAAQKREAEIKRWTRPKKLALVSGA
ncbi:MAG: GIY-YIG nuclease family protein [Candidatus Omnitrophica bacterium]|nr:GIY-YIG nuclease family protein [Candidatus Omnitrophota bacterium]